jgi:hypothetical protein
MHRLSSVFMRFQTAKRQGDRRRHKPCLIARDSEYRSWFLAQHRSSAGKIDGTMVEIEAPGGMGWNSGWFRSSDVLLTERPSTNVFFDVDECHRGSARYNSSWREILEYFKPAFQLGMTATPLRQEKPGYLRLGNKVYNETILHSFHGPHDGCNPTAK